MSEPKNSPQKGVENNNESISHELILHMLRIAFIEIRACENLRDAQLIADIFHNAPSSISASVSPNEIYRKIIRKAETHKMVNFVTDIKNTTSRAALR